MIRCLAILFLIVQTSCSLLAQSYLSEDFGVGGDTSSELGARWKLEYARGSQSFKAYRYLDAGSPCVRVDMTAGGPTIYSLYSRLDPVAKSKVSEVQVSLRYKTDHAVPILVAITAKPISVPPCVRDKLVMQADGQWHTAEWKLNVLDLPVDTMWFELIFETTGGPASYVQFDDIQVVALTNKAQAEITQPANFTLFDNAPDQKVAVSITASEQSQAGEYRFTLQTSDDHALVDERKVQVRDSGSVQFDLAGRKNAVYSVTGYDSTGESIGSWLIRKTEAREDAVQIRQGVPYVDGKPYLILGLYHTGDPILKKINDDNRNGTADFQLQRKDVLSQMKQRGFNTVFYTWNAPPRDYLDDAQNLNLKVICETVKNVSAIGPIKDHPAVLSWYGIDEPSAISIAECRTIYNKYRVADPYHPVMTAIISSQWTGMRGRFVDIAAIDDYPIAGPNSNVSMKEFISRSKTNFRVNSQDACIIAVPQLFVLDPNKEPTYPQLRSSVYSSITGGARGFLYYAYATYETFSPGMAMNPKRKHWFLPESPLWNQVGTLNDELLSLQDVILAGVDVPGVTVQADKPVDSRYFKSAAGTYLLLVNPTAEKISNVRIIGMKSAGLPLFESAAMNQTGNGQWSIDLEPYSVALYRQ